MTIIRTLALVAAAGAIAGTSRIDAPTVIPPSADTVDVALGSPVLDTKGMSAFATHIVVTPIGDAQQGGRQDSHNTISFGDSAGVAITRVHSATDFTTPNGPGHVTADFVFDRRTLALLSMRSSGPRGDFVMRANGTALEVTSPTPQGPRTSNFTLSAPAFYAQWSDFVVEELPHKMGTTYRVKLWSPARSPNAQSTIREESHLYTFASREDVTVLGKTHRQAWVVEDRDAETDALAGRMWIIDAAPKLVRWVINTPDGKPATQIDQEMERR